MAAADGQMADVVDVDESPVSTITADPDIWSVVLDFLPLPALKICSSTCHAHRALVPRRDALSLELTFENHDDATLLVRIREPQHESLVPARHPLLLQAVGSCPSLFLLHIDVSPPATYTSDWQRFSPNQLHETTRALHVRPPASTAGPLPWAVLPTRRLACLRLRATGANADHMPPKVEREEAAAAISATFLTCAIAATHSLTLLDLTGVGPAVMGVLLELQLPRLSTLRIGEECPSESVASQQGWSWPAATVLLLANAFPTLHGLDVGYARIDGGVAFRELELLCRACSGLRHLDLSMVMTLRDFGAGLRLLAQHAPNLTSLAIHGLDTPADALLTLARGCSQLSTVHFVSCRRDHDAALIDFLNAACSLTALDLTGGYERLPECGLLEWLATRRDARLPVQYLAVSRSTLQTPTFAVKARAIWPISLHLFDDDEPTFARMRVTPPARQRTASAHPEGGEDGSAVDRARTRLFAQVHGLLGGDAASRSRDAAAAVDALGGSAAPRYESVPVVDVTDEHQEEETDDVQQDEQLVRVQAPRRLSLGDYVSTFL